MEKNNDDRKEGKKNSAACRGKDEDKCCLSSGVTFISPPLSTAALSESCEEVTDGPSSVRGGEVSEGAVTDGRRAGQPERLKNKDRGSLAPPQ